MKSIPKMSQYRERSRFSRIITWKRLLLLTCFTVACIMILRTSSMTVTRDEKEQLRTRSEIAASMEWDKETVALFKKQLHLNEESEVKIDHSTCSDIWWQDTDYLIVTGFPPLDSSDLESHLWLFYNLVALEKFEGIQWPTVRLLLPSKTRKYLESVFETVQFGDLQLLTQCGDQVNVDRLLKYSRIVGHYDEISFDIGGKGQQLFIMNYDTKRVKELAEFDFSFVPYRPLFTHELMERIRPLIGRAHDLPAAQESVEEPAAVPHNFIGVHVDRKDNFPELVERIKAAMEYHRSEQGEVLFIVLCEESYKDDCVSNFEAEDTMVTGFKTTLEERFAFLSSCHGTIITNGISFFGALMGNGDVSLVNYERAAPPSNWLSKFAEKKEDWMIIEESGMIE